MAIDSAGTQGSLRRLVSLVTSLSVIAVVCGCSAPARPSPDSSPQLTGQPSTATPAPSSQLPVRPEERKSEAAIAVRVGLAALPTLPHELLPQRAPYRVVDANPYLDVEVPQVADAPVLTKLLSNLADGYVRSFRRTIRQQPAKGRYHGMSIDWQLIGRSRRIIGVEMWVTQQHGTHITIARNTVWYDQATRHLLELPSIFRAAAWPAVEEALVHALIDAGVPDRSPRAASAARALLRGGRPAFGFSADGELGVTFAAPALPAGAKPVSLKLNEAAISPRLSPVGLLVRDSARPISATQASGRPDCARHRCLALTFDDGPSSFTPRLVALLRQRKVASTFFLLGERVQQAPDLLADMNAAGMEIGNHSTYHYDLTSLSAATMRTDLQETSRVIAAVTGHQPRLMRPPYGARNRTVDRVAKELDMAEILWDVDTLDWRYPNAPRLTRLVPSTARQGSIVLLHDAINRSTITAMPAIIDQLQSRGFQLVTVSQLLGTTRPGQVYRRANTPSRSRR